MSQWESSFVVCRGGAPLFAKRRGALDHMAYWAEGLQETAAALRSHNVGLRLIRAPGSVRTWQLFFSDPNGVEVELDFAETETPPEDWKTFSSGPR